MSLTHKSPLLCRFVGFSCRPISHYNQQISAPANQVQISVFRGCSYSFNSNRLNHGHGTVFQDLGSSKIGFGQLSFDRVRLSAVAGGGSGGTGGGFGGSDDGNSGGRSEGGIGGSNWPFLSWYLALLAKYPVATKAVTSALLIFIRDLICQEWFSAVLANWQLWIPFQFLNFCFVPQQFQVLGANVIAVVWNVILSFKAHTEVLSK